MASKIKEKTKRSPKWSNEEIEVLLNEVEKHSAHVLGSFSATVTSQSKKETWNTIAYKVKIIVRALRLFFELLF